MAKAKAAPTIEDDARYVEAKTKLEEVSGRLGEARREREAIHNSAAGQKTAEAAQHFLTTGELSDSVDVSGRLRTLNQEIAVLESAVEIQNRIVMDERERASRGARQEAQAEVNALTLEAFDGFLSAIRAYDRSREIIADLAGRGFSADCMEGVPGLPQAGGWGRLRLMVQGQSRIYEDAGLLPAGFCKANLETLIRG